MSELLKNVVFTRARRALEKKSDAENIENPQKKSWFFALEGAPRARENLIFQNLVIVAKT